MTHSMTGNSATRAAGITSSHQEPPPTTTRATTEPARNVEIMYGEGCRQNARQAPAEGDVGAPGAGDPLLVGGQPLRGELLDLGRCLGHVVSFGAVLEGGEAVSRLEVAGRSTRSAAARAVSGSPSPMAAVSTR